LTEIYLCGVCPGREILRRHGRGQAGRGPLALPPFPQRQAAFSARREAKLAERRRAQEQAETQQLLPAPAPLSGAPPPPPRPATR
jgi:hypothetical protein